MTKVVLKGDVGSHGGSMTSASSSLTDGGTGVCRLGDSYACPKHGENAIIGGCTSTLLNEGIEVALDGATAACGASITGTGTLTNG